MGAQFAGQGGKANQFENWELEKKYKKNLEALKHEIEERNNEIMIARKEVQDYNNRVMRLEKEKRDLETRLIDKKARPPREMKEESQNQGFIDEIMKLKDENQNLQDVNLAYQREINVKITNKLEDIKREKI